MTLLSINLLLSIVASTETDMYYKPIYKLVKILQNKLSDVEAKEGKNVELYPWSKVLPNSYQHLSPFFIVSKVTLDIICLTAFGEFEAASKVAIDSDCLTHDMVKATTPIPSRTPRMNLPMLTKSLLNCRVV